MFDKLRISTIHPWYIEHWLVTGNILQSFTQGLLVDEICHGAISHHFSNWWYFSIRPCTFHYNRITVRNWKCITAFSRSSSVVVARLPQHNSCIRLLLLTIFWQEGWQGLLLPDNPSGFHVLGIRPFVGCKKPQKSETFSILWPTSFNVSILRRHAC